MNENVDKTKSDLAEYLAKTMFTDTIPSARVKYTLNTQNTSPNETLA